MKKSIRMKAMVVAIVISITGLSLVGCTNKDASKFKGSLKTFSTEDLDGNAVDESIFADYDITMVNTWATWCGPCVGEIPELEELHQQLPDNVNIISICMDAADEAETAKKILSDGGVTFQTLVGNKGLEDAFLNHLTGYPTTVFVDKEGNIVGEIMAGAPSSDVVGTYMENVNHALEAVK